MGEKIDAHQHLWRFSDEEYGWLTEPGYELLRRDFLPRDLLGAMAEAGVAGTVAVQARQTIEETEWLLDLAGQSVEGERSPICGVVGWAPLAEKSFPAVLEKLRENRLLKGFRHVVQGEAPGFLENSAFNRGVAALAGTGLVYDVLIFERQMEEAIAFVDRHPQQSFVLDHVGKPRIAAAELEPWSTKVHELARRENVTCKLSGLVTEADWTCWTPESLRPYLDVVVEAFGPERLMAGSDWPVCLVACGYGQWWTVLERHFAEFSEDERSEIFGGVASRVYGLRSSGPMKEEQ